MKKLGKRIKAHEETVEGYDLCNFCYSVCICNCSTTYEQYSDNYEYEYASTWDLMTKF